MFEDSKKRRRHRPKRRNRNLHPISNTHNPEEVSVVHDNTRRRIKLPAEQLIKGCFHLRHDSFKEANEVISSIPFRGDDIRHRREPEVLRRFGAVGGGDEGEPFLGDDEGYEDVGVFGDEELGEVHHGVDVAAAWVWYGHHVGGGGGWWRWEWRVFHGDEVVLCLLLRE